jgi:hypothetical protein
MLLKLYKREGDTMLYWEAWDENEEILVHFGQLGQMGETTTIPLAEFEPPATAIMRHADDARAAGFSEIETEDLYELIVQYSDASRGDAFVSRVEDLLNDVLGWTGLGHCDGSDIADGMINFFCFVVDPKVALDPLLHELREQELLDTAVIAYQDHDENFIVLWPAEQEDFDIT